MTNIHEAAQLARYADAVESDPISVAPSPFTIGDAYEICRPAKLANERMAVLNLRAAARCLEQTARDLEDFSMRSVVRSRNDLPQPRFYIDCAEVYLLRDADVRYGECMHDGSPLPDTHSAQPRPER